MRPTIQERAYPYLTLSHLPAIRDLYRLRTTLATLSTTALMATTKYLHCYLHLADLQRSIPADGIRHIPPFFIRLPADDTPILLSSNPQPILGPLRLSVPVTRLLSCVRIEKTAPNATSSNPHYTVRECRDLGEPASPLPLEDDYTVACHLPFSMTRLQDAILTLTIPATKDATLCPCGCSERVSAVRAALQDLLFPTQRIRRLFDVREATGTPIQLPPLPPVATLPYYPRRTFARLQVATP
jgi:hypothetical protein